MIKVLYNSERRRKAFITKELKQKKIAGDNCITSYFISLTLIPQHYYKIFFLST